MTEKLNSIIENLLECLAHHHGLNGAKHVALVRSCLINAYDAGVQDSMDVPVVAMKDLLVKAARMSRAIEDYDAGAVMLEDGKYLHELIDELLNKG